MAGADPGRLARLSARTGAESQSAKWMTVALAGVGALLLGALQLADVGALQETDRIAAAAVGGGLAGLGVVVAVVMTVGAMLPSRGSLTELRRIEASTERKDEFLKKWLQANRGALLRDRNDTVEKLAQAYEKALVDQRAAFEAYFANPGSAALEQRARESGDWVLFLNGLVVELVAAAKLVEARRAVQRSRVVVAGLAVVIAAGTVALVWATNPAEEPAADLRGANLTGTKLNGVELRGANLNGVTVKNADLKGTFLGDASVEGTKWEGTVCPDGVGSHNAGKTCAGHLEP
jgi:hypothetical protein